MYGLETMALENEHDKLQVCEHNWIRRIVGMNEADKRRMEEPLVEVGVKETFKKKLVSH